MRLEREMRGSAGQAVYAAIVTAVLSGDTILKDDRSVAIAFSCLSETWRL